jgi:hypothetical protein
MMHVVLRMIKISVCKWRKLGILIKYRCLQKVHHYKTAVDMLNFFNNL